MEREIPDKNPKNLKEYQSEYSDSDDSFQDKIEPLETMEDEYLEDEEYSDEDISDEDLDTPPPSPVKKAKATKSTKTPKLADADECLKLTNLDYSVLIGGSSNSGKTQLMLNLIHKNARMFSKIILISDSWTTQPELKKLLPKNNYWSFETCKDKLEKLMSEQKKSDPIPRVLLIFDDIIGKVNLNNDKVFKQLISQARHQRLYLWFLVQHVSSVIGPGFRSNVKKVYITKLRRTSLEPIYDFVSGFDSKQEFFEFMERNCRNYNAILIDDNNYNKTRNVSVFNPGLAPMIKIRNKKISNKIKPNKNRNALSQH